MLWPGDPIRVGTEIAYTYQHRKVMTVLSNFFLKKTEVILALLIATDIIAYTYQVCMVMILRTVKLLLNDGRADPNVLDQYGNYCLHLSIMNGHHSIVNLILEDGRVLSNFVYSNGKNCLRFLSNRHKLIIKR
jgi:ankyrin repeat protein